MENGINKNNIQKVQVIFLPSVAAPTQQSSVAYKWVIANIFNKHDTRINSKTNTHDSI